MPRQKPHALLGAALVLMLCAIVNCNDGMRDALARENFPDDADKVCSEEQDAEKQAAAEAGSLF